MPSRWAENLSADPRCIHGNPEYCPVCAADGDSIVRRERREKLLMLIALFCCGWVAGFACAFQLFA